MAAVRRRATFAKRTRSVQQEDKGPLTTITDEHIIPLVTLCERLKTDSVRGMRECNVKVILKKEGKNKIYRPKCSLSDMIGNRFSQSTDKEDKQFSKSEWNKLFGKQIPEIAIVIRDGERRTIAGSDIVVGDLIQLKEQDIVPADIRLKWSDHAFVDNRLITGKSLENRTHELEEAKSDCLISPNMVFAGTKVVHGQLVGIVIRTGENTVFASLKNHARKVIIHMPRSRQNSTSD